MVARKAASMIELVVAIVVMGIAVMTLPLMLERTQASNQFAMQQEAIHAAKTNIGDIVTFPWDENSLQEGVVGVLDTNSTKFKRHPDKNSTRRIGHVEEDKRRKFFTNETNASDIGGALTNNITDIGDFDGAETSLTGASPSEVAGVLDYRFDFNMTTIVRYVVDTNLTFGTTGSETNTSNIKMIEVTMQDDDTLSKFVLRAYSSNIGESQLLRRSYP